MIMTRLRHLLISLFSRTQKTKGGIDSGRDSFARLNKYEGKEKRNLLRKINNFRARKTTSSHQPFQPSAKTGPWRQRLLLVFCLVLAIGFFIKSSGSETLRTFLADLDYFSVTAVDVSGCRRVSAAQVRRNSGIVINSSLLFLDTDRVSAAIKTGLSWVKDVDVIRQWPDTAVIRVLEYEPEALVVKTVEGVSELHYMDRDGEPFVRVESGMDFDFPVITGLDLITDQEQRTKRFKEVLDFLELIRANNPNLPAQSVSEIHVDPEEGLVLYMVEYPFPVFFGNGDVRKKYVRLRKVLEVLYKPRKKGMEIAQVTYIRMDYLNDKVIVGYSESG
ncbi:MAG: FtsQ-type POTRA domain-containing protein [Desulfocapsaceae bacterium]|jgi:cell division septal protein FtsQ|nr:FtsQ-type POTRA domain-containing protein [Desulfocapsaceae bacterium]